MPEDWAQAIENLRLKIRVAERAAQDGRLTPQTRQKNLDAAKMGRKALELMEQRNQA